MLKVPTMTDPCRYQSPIPLTFEDITPIHQCLDTRGKNRGAEYIPELKVFEVKNTIILYKGSKKIKDHVVTDPKKYRLMEYHFHVPSEHSILGDKYPAEIHYVFYEIDNSYKANSDVNKRKLFDVHSGDNPSNDNILIIARVIIDDRNVYPVLEKLQVRVPMIYFEYDGSLTGEGDNKETVPVRWIVGKCPIKMSVDEIKQVAKTSRPLQPLDDRIILFSC